MPRVLVDRAALRTTASTSAIATRIFTAPRQLRHRELIEVARVVVVDRAPEEIAEIRIPAGLARAGPGMRPFRPTAGGRPARGRAPSLPAGRSPSGPSGDGRVACRSSGHSTTPPQRGVSGFKIQVSGRFAPDLEPETWNLKPESPGLRRVLGAWDGALITIGAVLGTAIFLTPADIARALPHSGTDPGRVDRRGVADAAGPLTYAEMGADVPARRRDVSLPEGSLRPARGIPLRMGLISRDHVGRHRRARRRVWRVPGRVRPVLLDATRARLRSRSGPVRRAGS